MELERNALKTLSGTYTHKKQENIKNVSTFLYMLNG